MKSYFFIPANNAKYLAKVQSIKADEIILELEDGIPEKDLETALKSIQALDNFKDYWVRPNMNAKVNGAALINVLFDLGFRKMIVPKAQSEVDLSLISTILNHKESRIILLIETPQILLHLEKIVSQYPIFGLGFGIHDFAQSFGTFPDYEKFKPYLLQILLIAKAYDLQYIDCPSMEIDKTLKDQFLHELKFISDLGGDGKFIIHPEQLNWFHEATLFTKEQVQWAIKINQKMMENPQTIENFDTLVVENQIIEKAHLKLVKKIVNWYETHK
jgi:citrate lyase subunit beta/citryl-CoA lyase